MDDDGVDDDSPLSLPAFRFSGARERDKKKGTSATILLRKKMPTAQVSAVVFESPPVRCDAMTRLDIQRHGTLSFKKNVVVVRDSHSFADGCDDSNRSLV